MHSIYYQLCITKDNKDKSRPTVGILSYFDFSSHATTEILEEIEKRTDGSRRKSATRIRRWGKSKSMPKDE